MKQLNSFWALLFVMGLVFAVAPLSANVGHDISHFFKHDVGGAFKKFGNMTKDAVNKATHKMDHAFKDALREAKKRTNDAIHWTRGAAKTVGKGVKKGAYATRDAAKVVGKGIKTAAYATGNGLKKFGNYMYEHRQDILDGTMTGLDKLQDFADSPAGQVLMEEAPEMMA
ncbi:MAG: hypothetical protein V6Z78_00230 [Holosporaceae bacterium]